MRLYIAEKKDVAEAISTALGGPSRPSGASFEVNGDHVTWLWGHLLRLTDPEEHQSRYKKWSMSDLPLEYPVSHVPESRHKQHLQQVIRLAKSASELVNAGDPDPEGQRLVDEVIEYAGLEYKPVKRVLINDNNAPAIRKAVDAMEDNANYRGLSLSALARSVCDQRYGFNLTRCYTLMARSKGYDGVLSVGRVQTPILGLVVNRDHAHESHNKQTFYTIQTEIAVESQKVKAIYQPVDSDPLDDKGRVVDEGFANEIVDKIRRRATDVLSVDTSNKQTVAPLPYNLLALQADAVGHWGYAPKKVLEITQQLRDKHKTITYNRSDCRYLNDERHEESMELLDALRSAFEEEVKYSDPTCKSKAFNSSKVTAHHAIIPTANVPELDNLSKEERNIYDLIARSYIAQFYPPEKYRATTVIFNAEGHNFKSTGRVDVSPGWKSLYQKSDSDSQDDDIEKANFEQLKAGNIGEVVHAHAKQEFTKPPARYSMKALLKDLARTAKYVTDPKVKKLLLAKDSDKEDEAGGIGTPATRDAHIDTLFRRGFLMETGKQIISTELGRNFFSALPDFAVKPDMTALWHEKQKMIEAGELDYQALISEVDQAISEEIKRAQSEGIDIKVDTHECPSCKKGNLKRRKGSKGFFWGCSNYPECKNTCSDKKGKPDLTAQKAPKHTASGEHSCPECKKGLVRRPAKRKGVFWWGCSAFPSCSFRAFDNKGRPEISE